MITPGRRQPQTEELRTDESAESSEVEVTTPSMTTRDESPSTPKLPYLFSPAVRSSQSVAPAKAPSPFTFNPAAVRAPGSASRSTTGASTAVSSPNRKLEEFFKKKGDAPLSDIEMEGVMALMRQAYEEAQKSEAEQPSTPAPEPQQPSIAQQMYPSVPTFATPVRQRPLVLQSQTVRAPRYNPILTPQRRRAMTPTLARPREIVFPTHSTPFKARTPKTVAATDASTSEPIAGTPVGSAPKPSTALTSTPETATPKRISTTASTLLSLISPVGTSQEVAAVIEQDRERVIDPALKPFVNPYAASSSSYRTPKRAKRKESVLGLSASVQRKRSNVAATPVAHRQVLKEIERTMPSEEKSAFEQAIATATPIKPAPSTPQESPSVVAEESKMVDKPDTPKNEVRTPGSGFSFDKFKPSKSSHLRESIVMSPPQSPMVANKDTDSTLSSIAKKASAPILSSPVTKNEEEKAPEFKITPINGFSGPPKASSTLAAVVQTAPVASDLAIERTPAEAKALDTLDYRAYLGRFFFYPVERASGQQAAIEKALESPELLYRNYKMRYTF